MTQGETTIDNFNLGRWVVKQRSKKEDLPIERRRRLEQCAGWTWDPRAARWETGYAHLEAYCQTEGDCLVKQTYKTKDDFNLGSWVIVQRLKKEKMPFERRLRLESLKGWSWDPHEDVWESVYLELKAHCEAQGDCEVPAAFKTADGVNLGTWIKTQRTRKNKLSSERRKKLESLKGWSWDSLSDRWETAFASLKSYSRSHGDCLVPRNHKTKAGFPLGHWLNNLRAHRDRLTQEQQDRVERLQGWAWDPHEYLWERGYSRLKNYIERNGNCLVPAKHVTVVDDYNLGQWVTNQRAKRNSLSADRRKRLESLPEWVWKAR